MTRPRPSTPTDATEESLATQSPRTRRRGHRHRKRRRADRGEKHSAERRTEQLEGGRPHELVEPVGLHQRCLGTSAGTMASKAGAANAVAAPITNATAHSSHRLKVPDQDEITARLPTATARAASAATSTTCRGRRSETAPPNRRRTTWGPKSRDRRRRGLRAGRLSCRPPRRPQRGTCRRRGARRQTCPQQAEVTVA